MFFFAYIKLLRVAELLGVPVISTQRFASRGVTTINQRKGLPVSIVLRPDMPIKEHLIALAHELGHVTDWLENPLTQEELGSAADGEALLLPRREKIAWDKAETMLRGLDVFSMVKPTFINFKVGSLKAYAEVCVG